MTPEQKHRSNLIKQRSKTIDMKGFSKDRIKHIAMVIENNQVQDDKAAQAKKVLKYEIV